MSSNVHRVLVFGGRNYNHYAVVAWALDAFFTSNGGAFVVIEGGALGADRMGRMWARSKGLPVITMAADWGSYAKSAGHIRNQWMIDHARPTYAIGFPGGAGTADMTNKLLKADIPLWLPQA